MRKGGLRCRPVSDVRLSVTFVYFIQTAGDTAKVLYQRCSPIILVFRLDAFALSVIATATWLAGWLAGWLSHSGIVSKPLNLSENFFDHLKAPSL